MKWILQLLRNVVTVAKEGQLLEFLVESVIKEVEDGQQKADHQNHLQDV